MKKLFLLLLLICTAALGASAQQVVKGQVVDASNGEPLIGATVQPSGGGTGVATDLDGRFSLRVPAGVKSLQVSYVGYETQSVAPTDGMIVKLESGSNSLDEVVVTALGIKRDVKALGFSAANLKGDDIAKTRTSDVMSSLAGKVAGVQIQSTSADPGSSNSVIIRGFSSLTGTNQPLYVVDGVPMNNTAVYNSEDPLNNGYDFGNGANAVNPDDVESMTILKGAAATALYGSRAANGVVLITTKKGVRQESGVGIEYNGGLQWESVLRLPQMQNEFGMGWYGEKTDNENGSWGPKFDGSTLKWGTVYDNSQQIKTYKAIPSNIKDFFDTGFRYSNSISFNGATDKSTYFASFSHVKDDGIIPYDKDTYKKMTFSARGSHKVKNVTFSSSLNYAYQANNFVTTGQGTGSMYNAIMQTPRDISFGDLKDLSNPFNTPGYYFTPYNVLNPYQVIRDNLNAYESERFYGKFQLDWDILPYLKFTYRIGLDTSVGHHETGTPNYAALYPDTPNYADELATMTGSFSEETTRRREINQDFMLAFDKDVHPDFHLNALVGFNGNERRYNANSSSITGLTIPTWYNISNSAGIPTVTQTSQKRRLYGVYAHVEGAYKNQLYLTLEARNDWSSTLPAGNRSFFYPGVTASWIFSENFTPELKQVIDFGKLRASWGKTGNDAAVYMTKSVYGQATSSSTGWGNSSFPFTKVGLDAYTAGNILGSANLSPEMSTEFEFGLNMAFFKNRLSLDATYYNRNSDKQITTLSMDPATGYTAQNVNLGKIRNHGFEVMLSVVPVRVADFTWTLNVNWTKNWNKVIDLPDELGNQVAIFGFNGGTGLYAIEGKELGIFKAYKALRDDQGRIIVNSNGIPQSTSELVECGSMNNLYQMGLGSTFSYKGLSLSVDFDIRKGGVFFSRTQQLAYFTGNGIQTAFNDRNPFIIPNSVKVAADGSLVENDISITATQLYNYWNNGGEDMDAASLIDKSYVKLRSVVLRWELPRKWLAKTFLTGASISVFGNNLFVWTPKTNTFVDPEASTFGNDLEGNFGEYSATPSSRKFGFNVQVKF